MKVGHDGGCSEVLQRGARALRIDATAHLEPDGVHDAGDGLAEGVHSLSDSGAQALRHAAEGEVIGLALPAAHRRRIR
jgi:hypothetical protein